MKKLYIFSTSVRKYWSSQSYVLLNSPTARTLNPLKLSGDFEGRIKYATARSLNFLKCEGGNVDKEKTNQCFPLLPHRGQEIENLVSVDLASDENSLLHELLNPLNC